MSLINNINSFMRHIKLEPTTESTESIPNYWIKIYNGRYITQDSLLLFQENVSIDYIKGINCAVKYLITNDAHNTIITINSNFILENCMHSDIILVFDSRYDNFEWQHFFEHENKDLRSKILSDPKKHNKEWKKFMKEYAHNKIGKTKRFLALIRISKYNYVIQFNSIDFLNGFEMVRTWSRLDDRSRNFPSMREPLHLLSVYDTLKICKISITFQTPQKEMNRLLIIFQQINKYLPLVLAQLILQIFAQCDYHACGYDSCLTHSIESTCFFHQKIVMCEKVQLENCMPQIHLEQL